MKMQDTMAPPPQLSPLVKRVIGFVDTTDQLTDVLSALQLAGFSPSRILSFSGEEGLRSVEHLRREISLAEDEQELLSVCLSELQEGHIGIEVVVTNQNEARLVSETATPLQARRFTYFGPWYTLRLT